MCKRFFIFLVVFVVSVTAFSCSNTNNKPIIEFSSDRTSIVIKNIDEVSLLQIKNSYKSDSGGVDLINVLLTPGDQDSLQTEEIIKGKLTLLGDSLVFSPAEPFMKGKNYLVESYIGVKFGDGTAILKGNLKHKLQPLQQILTR